MDHNDRVLIPVHPALSIQTVLISFLMHPLLITIAESAHHMHFHTYISNSLSFSELEILLKLSTQLYHDKHQLLVYDCIDSVLGSKMRLQ